MKIFLDSAKLEEITEACSLGIIDGITTNPSLIKEAAEKELKRKGYSITNETLEEYIEKILLTAERIPVSLEVTEMRYSDMIPEGYALYKMFNKLCNNVYIKIPVNTSTSEYFNNIPFDGIKTIKELSRLKVPINCTLIFTPEQALMAAKAGAKIVSPFVGRLDDMIRDKNNISYKKEDYFPAEGLKEGKFLDNNGIVSGVDLVAKCCQIFEKHKIKTEILATSIRNVRQLREVALAGANIASVPFYVLKNALQHEKTKSGVEKFRDDTIKEYTNLRYGFKGRYKLK